jgi:serine/threonine protein kinase
LITKFKGKLSEAQITHIMIDICKGLTHLHSKGIAHRDIKVENILLHNKQFKLCDFGSASKQVLDHDDPNLSDD